MEKVRVVKDACIGCGSCAAICPDVFEIADDGFAQVKSNIDFETDILNTEAKTPITEEIKKDVMDAIDGCPTGAIEIYE